jgi:hypothetical protein
MIEAKLQRERRLHSRIKEVHDVIPVRFSRKEEQPFLQLPLAIPPEQFHADYGNLLDQC